MIIWFSLIVPFLGNLVKRVLYHKETKWWEYLVDYGVTIPVILILKFTMSASLVSDTEYLGYYATQSWYYQGWDEWVEDTCTRVVGEDEDGNDITEEYDCSYERENAPYVEYILNNDTRHRMATGTTGGFLEFGNSWARKRFAIHDQRVTDWGNESFKDMHRDHNGTDGDAFVSLYQGDTSTIYPWTEVQRYVRFLRSRRWRFRKIRTL